MGGLIRKPEKLQICPRKRLQRVYWHEVLQHPLCFMLSGLFPVDETGVWR